MQVEIYSAYLPAGHSNMTPDVIMKLQQGPLNKLQNDVNAALGKHPTATVQWLQHAAASTNGHFVQVTAVVSY